MNATLQSIFAAAASFFFVTLVFFFLLLVCKKVPKKSTQRHSAVQPRSLDLRSVSTSESASFDPSLHQISMAELSVATNNFSSDLIIGDGSFGLVYRAQLSNGVTVAIKKLDPDAFQGFREFRAEMETLGRLRHPNIVKMLGYCVSGPDRVLIYEYVERGSLDQWIHDTTSSFPRSSLSWEMRVKVVRGIANGLAYLHGLQAPIIHRDIKASNILLDSNFEVHIADFGLARCIQDSHTHVSTQVAGTMGYMPPEYREGNTAATFMADVYSFGILMLEIATQRRPNWPVKMDGREVGLAEWARKMLANNRHMDMVDSKVARETLDEEKVHEYFRIACMCANEAKRERPAMRDVVALLLPL